MFIFQLETNGLAATNSVLKFNYVLINDEYNIIEKKAYYYLPVEPIDLYSIYHSSSDIRDVRIYLNRAHNFFIDDVENILQILNKDNKYITFNKDFQLEHMPWFEFDEDSIFDVQWAYADWREGYSYGEVYPVMRKWIDIIEELKIDADDKVEQILQAYLKLDTKERKNFEQKEILKSVSINYEKLNAIRETYIQEFITNYKKTLPRRGKYNLSKYTKELVSKIEQKQVDIKLQKLANFKTELVKWD